MATNDTFELQVHGLASGQLHIHTLHFRAFDPAVEAADLIAHWQANAMTAYRGMFHTSALIVGMIRAAKVCGTVPLPAPVEVVPSAPNQAGTRTITGDGAPSFLACTVAEKGTLAGRSRRGRFFIGGIFEFDSVYNDFTATYLAVVEAYCTALKAAYITGTPSTWQQVVHSRKLASVPGTACNVSSDRVTALIVNPRVTTMRSRKFGHGS